MEIEQVSDAVALLRAGVDAVLDCDLTALDGVGVASLLEEIDVARRRLDAADTRALAVAEDRRVDGQFGAASLVDLLTARLRLDAPEARRRVRRCEDLGPRHTLTGEPLPAILPATAAALVAGEIHAGHADVITRFCASVDALPDAQPDDSAVAETLLLDVARHDAPKIVARTGQELLAHLDQDGTEPADQRLARKRGITVRDHPDGSSEWKVFADAELTALRSSLFDTLAAPLPDPDGEPDPRSPAQRRHDALTDALARVMRSGDLPAAGGVPTTVLAHVHLDQLPRTGQTDLDRFTWHGRPDIIDQAKHQLTDQPTGRPTDRSTDRPADRPTDGTTDRATADRATEQLTDRAAEDSADAVQQQIADRLLAAGAAAQRRDDLLEHNDVLAHDEDDDGDGDGEGLNRAERRRRRRARRREAGSHAAGSEEAGSGVSEGHSACDGYAVTSNGGLLPGRLLGIAMCQAEVDILVTSADGAVLAFGRSTRLATRLQRLVLAGRDGGCAFPGCTRPPAWCEAHHVIPWLSGGRTDVNNLCLLCPYHHRRFEQLGWTVRMTNGVPQWTPPKCVDPEQKPIRNRATHLLDFEFTRAFETVRSPT